jgi:hypothetical protein
VTGSGDVHVTGSSLGTLHAGTGPTSTGCGADDLFVVKLPP